MVNAAGKFTFSDFEGLRNTGRKQHTSSAQSSLHVIFSTKVPFANIGLPLLPRFRTVRTIKRSEDEIIAWVPMPALCLVSWLDDWMSGRAATFAPVFLWTFGAKVGIRCSREISCTISSKDFFSYARCWGESTSLIDLFLMSTHSL